MNNRGHLPTFLIILVAIVLMVAAWFTYLTFDGSSGRDNEQAAQNSRELALFERYVKGVFDDAVLYAKTQNDKCAAFKYGVAGHDYHFVQAGNFFAIARNTECTELIQGNKVVMEGVFVSSQVGFNKFRREFNLEADLG